MACLPYKGQVRMKSYLMMNSKICFSQLHEWVVFQLNEINV